MDGVDEPFPAIITIDDVAFEWFAGAVAMVTEQDGFRIQEKFICSDDIGMFAALRVTPEEIQAMDDSSLFVLKEIRVPDEARKADKARAAMARQGLQQNPGGRQPD